MMETSVQATPVTSDESFGQWLEAKRKPILMVALVAALFWTVLYLQFTVDDAFISFRYGKNLVAHHVWNWNVSGTREEAYTSATYAVLGILPALVHLSPALFFKLFGVACIGAMIYRLRTFAVSPFAPVIGVLLIALHPWVWLHAFAGLETPLYMLLLLEIALCVHRAPTVSPLWVYTIFLLLPLTRPEGILFACLGVALFWVRRGSAPKHLLIFAASVFLGIGYFLARWHYFHHLFPNPFYFKLAAPTAVEIRSNLLNTLTEEKGYYLVLILVAVFARNWYARAFAVCATAVLLVLYAPHYLDMNYADRFYFEMAFPILLFFLIVEDLSRVARIAAVAAAILLFSINVPYLRTALKYFPYWTQSDIDLGKQLAPFGPSHTLLTGDGGAIPYYSNWTSYDFQGLGNNRIAQDGLSYQMLEEVHPDLILIESYHPGPGVLYDSTSRGTRSRFATEIDFLQQTNDYEYVGESDYQGIYNIIFLRKDIPDHDEIVRAVQRNTRTSAEAHMSIKDLLLQAYVPWRD
jgi:arabinofuranosyltransferase